MFDQAIRIEGEIGAGRDRERPVDRVDLIGDAERNAAARQPFREQAGQRDDRRRMAGGGVRDRRR